MPDDEADGWPETGYHPPNEDESLASTPSSSLTPPRRAPSSPVPASSPSCRRSEKGEGELPSTCPLRPCHCPCCRPWLTVQQPAPSFLSPTSSLAWAAWVLWHGQRGLFPGATRRRRGSRRAFWFHSGKNRGHPWWWLEIGR